MANDIPQLRTSGVIAAELGTPLARVLYVLRTRNVKPIGRAGCLRLFGPDAVAIVREALREIDEAKVGARTQRKPEEEGEKKKPPGSPGRPQ